MAADERSSSFALEGFIVDAEAVTGLSVPHEATYAEPLAVLLDSLDREADFDIERRQEVRGELLDRLCSRLRLDDDIDRHPAALEQAVTRPVIIVGFARSGTTLLHELVAQDPASRAPRYWEVMYPSPAPRPDEPPDEARWTRAAAEIELLLRRAPGIAAQHPYYVSDGPGMIAECVHMFMLNFTSAAYTGFYNTPTFTAWLAAYDYVNAYPFHRRFLQYLQHGWPERRWTLKDPTALSHFEALYAAYPDARFVWTHREPVDVLSSVVNHIRTFQRVDGAVALQPIIDRTLASQLESIAVVTGSRDRSSGLDAAFFDVDYDSLVSDPITTVEALYHHFALPFTPEFRQLMEAWLTKNPPNRHGAHIHEPDALGLDVAHVDAAFRNYRERYGLSASERL